MASGRRTSLPARDAHGSRGGRGKASARIASARIKPLYKRLPHGPHRLARDEVILNQRARIHGAMGEAVARNRDEETRVKQVIGLAGVSRRSFYEQFANKQECFLATFDLIVRRELQRVRRAYLASEGTLQQRMYVGVERFAHTAVEDRNATVLVVLEAQTSGVPGVLRLRRATCACERMLAQSFAQTPGAVQLPMPIVRGIAGGLHGGVAGFLHAEPPLDGEQLAQELTRWALLFQTPAAQRLSECMATRLTRRIREISSTYGHRLAGAEASSRDERTRLQQAVLRLATREDYRVLSAPQIADEANVSIDAFCEMFPSKDACHLAALDMIGDELLAIAADPDLVSSDWPHAVRRVLAQLMSHLAAHPLHTRTLAHQAFFAGPEARERIVDLAHSIVTLLIEGAPAQARGALTPHALAGALWHTIRCQVATGRIPLLAALSDHLAYIVLAPHLGADAAVEALEEPAPAAAS